MIVIPYPSGAFGSTLEYVLRHYSNELATIDAAISESGNMHGFTKECHPLDLAEFIADAPGHEIVTPPYPNFDAKPPLETLGDIKRNMPLAKVVLIYCSTIEEAELCQLFTFHKTNEYLSANLSSVAHRWNPKYTSYKEMQMWEQREALSFLIDRQVDLLGAKELADNTWLTITPSDILNNFINTVDKIYRHCGLSFVVGARRGIDSFYDLWRSRQQSTLDEYALTQGIIRGEVESWEKLSLLGEAIVQSGLRKRGINIACDGLNVFPTTLKELIN